MGTEGGWDRVCLWPGLPILTAGHLSSTPRQGLCSWVREDPVPVLPCTDLEGGSPHGLQPRAEGQAGARLRHRSARGEDSSQMAQDGRLHRA